MHRITLEEIENGKKTRNWIAFDCNLNEEFFIKNNTWYGVNQDRPFFLKKNDNWYLHFGVDTWKEFLADPQLINLSDQPLKLGTVFELDNYTNKSTYKVTDIENLSNFNP